MWNGSILTDQVITQAIFELRKILKQHSDHPYGYIVTVPKRGYKLDATVERVIEAPTPVIEMPSTALDSVEHDEERAESSHLEMELPEPESSIEVEASTLPAPESLPPRDKTNTTPQQKRRFKKRWFVTSGLLVLGVALSASYLHVKQNTLPTPLPKPVSTPSYLSYEPRYIHVILEPDVLNDPLKVGFTKKLLELLKTYKDFRIIYSGPAAKVAANELRFAATQKGDDDFLEIEYLNRISGLKHIDRKYQISEAMLKPSMKKSLDDLLDSFSIEIDKDELASLVDELPDNSSSTASALTSLGAAYHNYSHVEALDLIHKAQNLSPNNPYVVATSYIFDVSHVYLDPPDNMLQRLKQLNDEAASKFEQFSQTGQNTPRVLEASAMMALTNDKPLKAKSILQAIPHERRTVFFYILNAKASELTGNRDVAEEFYYHAVLETSTIEVLNLSEVLFFNSDLSDIKKKVETSLAENDSV